jgi:membrane protein
MKKRFLFLIDLFKTTIDRWSDVEGARRGAAFSYYATFSIFPLLLLAVTTIGFVIGDDVPARERVLSAFAAPGTAVHGVLEKTLSAMQGSGHSARGLSAAIGIVTLLFGASGAFVELDATLNRIWCVPARKSKGILGSIKVLVMERLSGFAIVLGLGLTLLTSLVMSSLLAAVAERARHQIDTPLTPALLRTTELAASIALLSAVFIAAFHFIPRSRPPLRDVAGGAVLTTVLLTILKELFASYLSQLTSYSAYGIAGGVLALATWIYLSSQVIFFGAQLTRVHAEKLGSVGDCDQERANAGSLTGTGSKTWTTRPANETESSMA